MHWLYCPADDGSRSKPRPWKTKGAHEEHRFEPADRTAIRSANAATNRSSRLGNEERIREAEAITGTILIVEPGEGVVILVRRGPTELPSTVLQGDNNQVKALKGPGQTNYGFRITGSTVVKVGGKPVTPADLGKIREPASHLSI